MKEPSAAPPVADHGTSAAALPRVEVKTASRASEGKIALKAMLSSLLATLADGLVYQLLLCVVPALYGSAAFAGALAGAATNFSINRVWAFERREQPMAGQMLRYAIVSLLTFGALRFLLWLFIEELGASARVGWLPAKLLAWLLVSYPAQRFWVFTKAVKVS
jgi:putative flippase GtrA